MTKFKFTILIISLAIIFVLGIKFALADEVTTEYLFGGDVLTTEQLAAEAGLGSSDPREVAAKVINVILGFLGIIAVVLILIGGFMWMTAAGNEDKIARAKKFLLSGVIGLIIILAAFGIAKFVLNALIGVTDDGSSAGADAGAVGTAPGPGPGADADPDAGADSLPVRGKLPGTESRTNCKDVQCEPGVTECNTTTGECVGCVDGDGFCPSFCNFGNDNDCEVLEGIGGTILY